MKRRALLFGTAGLAFAVLLLIFYLDQRNSLIEQRQAKFSALEEATSLLQRENSLRQLTARMGTSVTSDSSAAEGQLLHLVHDWEQRAGAKNASFQRVGMGEEHGFILLTFQVSAAGNMSAIAAFLYQIETAAIPLRIESVQAHPKNDADDQVQIHLEISTLCRGNAQRFSTPSAASAAQLARGSG
ncbi:MAG: GspMb/PilO family protein [Tepidisphaeraceae bacterium]